MEKLYTRRDFFRKAANKVLPVLLLAGIPAMDVVAKAAPRDCKGDCKRNCKATCKGTCMGTCMGACEMRCSYTCGDACGGSCKGTCRGSARGASITDTLKVDTLKIN